jgi:deoxycytidine triphosphate deaminase
MLLIGDALKRCIVTGKFKFSGEVRKDSLLLTLGEHLQLMTTEAKIIDPYNPESLNSAYGNVVDHWHQIYIEPHQFILITVAEYLKLGNRHFGIISTLSHVARLGLMAHAGSYFVDRYFEGYLTLEVTNLTHHTFMLYQGTAKPQSRKVEKAISENTFFMVSQTI